MARRGRKQDESVIAALFELPWQVSFVLGIFVFLGLKWVLPVMGADNLILKPMLTALSGMAWLFSGFFFLVGFLVFVKKKTAQAMKQQLPPVSRRNAPGKPEPVWQAPVWAAETIERSASPGGAAITRGLLGEPLASATSNSSVVKRMQEACPTEWSLDLIRRIEWKRFEDVCQRFYALKGIRSETTPLGPDGGIDIRLYQDGSERASSIVQCKAWGERIVGVKLVRELLGVMTHEQIGKAFFMASGRFSDDAKELAKSNRITLIDGPLFLMMIQRLCDADRADLLSFATAGEYTTPTCPRCGVKMRAVPGKEGRPSFWGCQRFPKCRQRLGMRRDSPS